MTSRPPTTQIATQQAATLPPGDGQFVTTRTSFLDTDGQQKTYDLTLRLGATDAELEQALEQAGRMMAATVNRFHYQHGEFDPEKMLMSYGKYLLSPVGVAVRQDPRYFVEWVLEKSNPSQPLREAIMYVLERMQAEGDMPHLAGNPIQSAGRNDVPAGW